MLAKRRNHAEIQLFLGARVRARRVRQQQPICAKDTNGGFDLLIRRHARREHRRATGRTNRFQQLAICERRRGDLDARRVEAFDELNRIGVPARNEPADLLGAAVVVDLLKLFAAEFDFVAIVHVGDIAPGRLAHFVAHVGGNAFFRSPLLELHGIAAAGLRDVDKPLRNLQAAVMVDSNFGDDVDRLAVADRSPR